MTTHSECHRILCFGDSNTWGYIPGTGKRYPASVRWTGVLQSLLGEHYEIIEEGLNARTTNIEDPENEGKNGAQYLKPCLQTHTPVDSVILFLGTNDLKKRFDRSPEEIAQGIDTLLSIMHDPEYTYGVTPHVILLAPPFVDESVNGVQDKYQGAEEKSKQLAPLYQKIAEKYEVDFIDLSQHIKPSLKDGYHLEADAHDKIAKLVKEKTITIALSQ